MCFLASSGVETVIGLLHSYVEAVMGLFNKICMSSMRLTRPAYLSGSLVHWKCTRHASGHLVFMRMSREVITQQQCKVTETEAAPQTSGLAMPASAARPLTAATGCRALWSSIRAAPYWKYRHGPVSTVTCSSWMACGPHYWSISLLWTRPPTHATWATPKS